MSLTDDTRQWITELVERYEGPLCRYARRLLGDPDRAQDAVQETFLRLCRTERRRLAGAEQPWLFTVCRSRALDQLRKEGRMSGLSEERAAAVADPQPGPAGQAAQQEEAARVAQALGRLPQKEQEVLRLKFQEGLRYREIAQVVQTTEANVGFLIHSGLTALRATLVPKTTHAGPAAALSAGEE